jgi:hypothetical protein
MKLFNYSLVVFLLVFAGCEKEPEEIVFSGNNAPPYSGVPTLLVENYVNRLYIDLIGREPTDAEMNADVATIEAGNLSIAARTQVIEKLMDSEVIAAGEVSYNEAYHQKFYDDCKARFLEGASEVSVYEQYYLYYYISVQDSMNGDMLAYELMRAEANKVKDVIDSRDQFRTAAITVDEMCRRMCFNSLYDELHMNTFNYINATFNDLFFRFPTDVELDQCMEPVETNVSGQLFGHIISSKAEYIDLLVHSEEFAEGMIRWTSNSLLSREPTTVEVYNLLPVFNNGQDIKAVQRTILLTDEYAGFE